MLLVERKDPKTDEKDSIMYDAHLPKYYFGDFNGIEKECQTNPLFRNF